MLDRREIDHWGKEYCKSVLFPETSHATVGVAFREYVFADWKRDEYIELSSKVANHGFDDVALFQARMHVLDGMRAWAPEFEARFEKIAGEIFQRQVEEALNAAEEAVVRFKRIRSSNNGI